METPQPQQPKKYLVLFQDSFDYGISEDGVSNQSDIDAINRLAASYKASVQCDRRPGRFFLTAQEKIPEEVIATYGREGVGISEI